MSETRPPSGYAIERSVSAWQQVREALLADPDLVLDELVITAALVAADITNPDVLLERLIDAAVWCDRRADEAEELRKNMIARRDRYRARLETMRATILNLMSALEKSSHRAKLGLAVMSMSRPGVLVTDADKLAPEYVRVTVTREPDKTAIRADLDQGVVVEGAVMSNAVPVLTIRKA